MYETSTTSTSLAPDAEQYLTFRLDNLDYSIPIKQVQEIRGWTRVTPLPNSPRYIKGVLNLRGTIVPIIDLRLRFNLSESVYDASTVIIVVNVGGRLAGLVVDAVSDVISLTPDQRRNPPEFEGHANRQFIHGLSEVEEKLLVLIDVEKLVNQDVLTQSTEAAA